MSVQILTGDCRVLLETLPAQSVQCCVTSPPYWGLRDYGTGSWEGGDNGCDHREATVRIRRNLAEAANACDGGNRTAEARLDHNALGIPFRDTCGKCGAVRTDLQIGLEKTPAEYVAAMVQVFAAVWRVLRADGTLWLNLGDSYAAGGMGKGSGKQLTNRGTSVGGHMDKARKAPTGLKPKDLVGIPWMVAFALRENGWYLRQDIIWVKPNPMPESVTDRCTKSHEYIFLLTKSERYFYDHEAIKEPSVELNWASRYDRTVDGHKSNPDALKNGLRGRTGKTAMRGQGHFRDRDGPANREGRDMADVDANAGDTRNKRDVWTVATNPYKEAHFATFPPDLIKPCIMAGTKPGDTVLDPFGGSGTTGMVALELGRKAILVELNPKYAALANGRTNVTPGLAI